jgi:hypothetical protein
MHDANLAQNNVDYTADNKGCQRSMQMRKGWWQWHYVDEDGSGGWRGCGRRRRRSMQEHQDENGKLLAVGTGLRRWSGGLGALNAFRVWNRIVLAWCPIQKTSSTCVLNLWGQGRKVRGRVHYVVSDALGVAANGINSGSTTKIQKLWFTNYITPVQELPSVHQLRFSNYTWYSNHDGSTTKLNRFWNCVWFWKYDSASEHVSTTTIQNFNQVTENHRNSSHIPKKFANRIHRLQASTTIRSIYHGRWPVLSFCKFLNIYIINIYKLKL